MATIHTYSAPLEAFLVNSLLIETPNGVVVMDAQFLATPAKTLKQNVAAIGKSLLGVIITLRLFHSNQFLDMVRQFLKPYPRTNTATRNRRSL